MAAGVSVVIPAHDEGELLVSTLERVTVGTAPAEFEIVVVANGCTDDTAQRARAVPGVRVVEIDQASKIAALNAGDAAASIFPRIYLDADVEVTAETLRELGAVLRSSPEPRVASPQLVVDASRSSWPVRQHVRIWQQSDYHQNGHIGSGIYAVNEAGRRRWEQFPDVVADDRFVQQRFLASERISLSSHQFTVRAPRNMAAHVRRATRIAAGNRELRADQQVASADPAARRFTSLLSRVARRPELWPALPFYLYGYGVPLVRARSLVRSGAGIEWARDNSLRDAALSDSARGEARGQAQT